HDRQKDPTADGHPVITAVAAAPIHWSCPATAAAVFPECRAGAHYIALERDAFRGARHAESEGPPCCPELSAERVTKDLVGRAIDLETRCRPPLAAPSDEATRAGRGEWCSHRRRGRGGSARHPTDSTCPLRS